MSFYFERLALDSKSVRSYDDNGNLHVKTSPLTRVQVAPYRGNEIPDWQRLRLDPQKIYRGYRPAEELSKPETIDSVNGIPIQLNHHPDYPDDPAKETRIGSTGTDACWDEPFLYNSLHFQDKKAIDRINDGSMRELSLAYRYDPDFTPGKTPDGEAYDFVMRNISANHVALVEEGRAGRDVLVLDHSLNLGDNDMENEKKPLPQDGDPGIEASEVAAAKQIKDGAQKIIDLHDETPAGEIKDKGDEDKQVGSDSEGVGDKDKLIMDILKQLVQSGLSAEVSAKFKGALEELAGSNAEKPVEDEKPDPLKDDEEVKEPPADDKEKETKEPEGKPQEAPQKDEKDLISDALKACGLDGEDPEVQQAFTAGLKYNNKEKDDEEGAEDEELEDMPSGEGAPAPDIPAVGMGQDAAMKLTKEVERNISAKYRAAEEVASVTGKLKVHAYDSAGDIYIEALKKLGLNVKNIRKNEAQIAYRAYMEGQKNATKKKLAQDSSLKKNDSLISKFLNNVGSAY